MRKIGEWIKHHPIGFVSLILLGAVIAAAATIGRTPSLTANLLEKSAGSSFGVSAPGVVMGRSAITVTDEAMDMGMMEEAGTAFMPSPMPPVEPTAGETAAEVEQRIIKTGTLRMVVGDILATIEEITSQVSAVGGFVENSSMSEDRSGKKAGWITVRVPVDRFDATVSHIRDLAELVRDESVQGQDVTEQYTDLEARLRNAKEQEEAYLAILAQAKSVEDILKVQRELGNIRSQIESYEGRLKYLQNRTSYSTINVTLETEPDVQIPTKEFKLVNVVKEAVQALVSAFQWILTALVWVVIVGLSLLLSVGLVLWLLVIIIRRIFRKKR